MVNVALDSPTSSNGRACNVGNGVAELAPNEPASGDPACRSEQGWERLVGHQTWNNTGPHSRRRLEQSYLRQWKGLSWIR